MKLSEPQAAVLDLLNRRLSPQRMLTELDWARSRLYKVMDELTEIGLLRALGELPDGAKSLTWPSQEWIDGCALALPAVGWDDTLVKRLQRDQSRAGQFPPEADDRYGYSRTDWTGHAVRRAEWGDWVVQGLILPRLDGRYWKQATPEFRAVSLNEMPLLDSGGAWLRRGVTVPVGMIRDLDIGDEIGLTMAVAWVMESRALLDVEALAILSGGDSR